MNTNTNNTYCQYFQHRKNYEIGVIKSLNINKAHGHDNISIRSPQICGAEVVKSFITNF